MPNGREITVRLDTTAKDTARKLNRSENVRQIAPNDPDFKRTSHRRNNIESINRGLDDSMWLGRAHSKGANRQLLNLIGYAVMVNGLAMHLHRKRQAGAAARLGRRVSGGLHGDGFTDLKSGFLPRTKP